MLKLKRIGRMELYVPFQVAPGLAQDGGNFNLKEPPDADGKHLERDRL